MRIRVKRVDVRVHFEDEDDDDLLDMIEDLPGCPSDKEEAERSD